MKPILITLMKLENLDPPELNATIGYGNKKIIFHTLISPDLLNDTNIDLEEFILNRVNHWLCQLPPALAGG